MIRWLLHIGLGRLVALLQRKGYLTDAEAVKAAAAVETLAEIGVDEAGKKHGKSEDEIKVEGAIEDRLKRDPDNVADLLNQQEAERH